jgi:hypothetical protein
MSKRKSKRREVLVTPETIERLGAISGLSEHQIRRRLAADPALKIGCSAPDEECIVVGSPGPALPGSRRETCSRCGGACWLIDTPIPGAVPLCLRCFTDEAPEFAWMQGPPLQ